MLNEILLSIPAKYCSYIKCQDQATFLLGTISANRQLDKDLKDGRYPTFRAL